MTNYQTLTLENGLRIIHQPSSGNVCYCGFMINAGTRDESCEEYGLAHFIEHMLFKGTTKRTAYHILNRMESVGGELNAYTNKEETVIYSIFLNNHFERAIELISDLVFNSQFPQNELDKEKYVVIDEIHSYEDNPAELIYDEFENILFANSQIGHNILGVEDSVNSFTINGLNDFVSNLYCPSNMIFFSMGNIDFAKIKKLANKYLSSVESRVFDNQRITPSVIKTEKRVVAKNTSQAHMIIGSRSYEIGHKGRKVLHLLNNILGGPGMNSRLNLSLREKRGYVYNVESNITAYTDTGIFSIYFGCDKSKLSKCDALVYTELKKLRDNKLTNSQLSAAKKQLIGQIGILSDNKENVALSIGKSYFHNDRLNSLEEIFAKIDSITSSQLLETANEIFDENNLFSLIYN